MKRLLPPESRQAQYTRSVCPCHPSNEHNLRGPPHWIGSNHANRKRKVISSSVLLVSLQSPARDTRRPFYTLQCSLCLLPTFPPRAITSTPSRSTTGVKSARPSHSTQDPLGPIHLTLLATRSARLSDRQCSSWWGEQLGRAGTTRFQCTVVGAGDESRALFAAVKVTYIFVDSNFPSFFF